MAKITLDTITSSYASTSLFQSNFSAIATELNDKVLYRVNPTGEANQMMNNLDMNSNDILNIQTLEVDTLSVDGTFITPNTNLQTQTYLDTEFTTVAAQDTFSAAYTVGFVDVYINGVLLANADYTATDGTNVVLATPVTLDTDVVTVRAFSSFSAGDGITQTAADARYLQGANNLSEITNAATARTTLDTYSKSETRALLPNRNLLINGDFSVNQRGFNGVVSTSGVDTLDRVRFYKMTGDSVSVQQRVSTAADVAVTGQYNDMQIDFTSTDAVNGGVLFGQSIENGIQLTAGKDLTMSAKIYSGVPRQISLEYYRAYAGGSADTRGVGSKIDLVAGWQDISVTVPQAALTTETWNDGTFLQVVLWLSAGSTHDSSTQSLGLQPDGSIVITGWQVELGDTATDFEYISPADQLVRCHRYFERKNYANTSMIATGQAYSTADTFADLKFLEKRSTPTVVEGGAGMIQGANSVSAATGTATFSVINKESCRISIGGAVGLVAGNASMVLSSGVTYIDIDAEL